MELLRRLLDYRAVHQGDEYRDVHMHVMFNLLVRTVCVYVCVCVCVHVCVCADVLMCSPETFSLSEFLQGHGTGGDIYQVWSGYQTLFILIWSG